MWCLQYMVAYFVWIGGRFVVGVMDWFWWGGFGMVVAGWWFLVVVFTFGLGC